MEDRFPVPLVSPVRHFQTDMVVGKDKSVISRELKRNRGKHGYHPALAHQMAEERKERFGRPHKFTDTVRQRIIKDLSNEQYSPEQIAGLARREGRPMVSHTRIYQFIREDKANGGGGNSIRTCGIGSNTGKDRSVDFPPSRTRYP